ncbi:MAG: hypothetical protein Kow0069_28330 [Promethearchaeota archaeon]
MQVTRNSRKERSGKATKKGVLLRLSPEEFERLNRCYLERAESEQFSSRNDFLRFLVTRQLVDPADRSTSPANENVENGIGQVSTYRCGFCSRVLLGRDELERHEDRCAKNPKNAGIPIREVAPISLATVLKNLHDVSLHLENALRTLEATVVDRLETLEGELKALRAQGFKDQRWDRLSEAERDFLLGVFLERLSERRGRRGFRPSHFKRFLDSLGVRYSPEIISYNQDEVALYLKSKVGEKKLVEAAPSTYSPRVNPRWPQFSGRRSAS